jgi:hypothetical protein
VPGMKVVHCIKSLTKAALWNDHFNDVREISLYSLCALSAFVTGHVRISFQPEQQACRYSFETTVLNNRLKLSAMGQKKPFSS